MRIVIKKQPIWRIDVDEEFATGSLLSSHTGEYIGLTIAPRMLTAWIDHAHAGKDYTAAVEDYWRRHLPLLEKHYGPFIPRTDDIDLLYRKVVLDPS